MNRLFNIRLYYDVNDIKSCFVRFTPQEMWVTLFLIYFFLNSVINPQSVDHYIHYVPLTDIGNVHKVNYSYMGCPSDLHLRPPLHC